MFGKQVVEVCTIVSYWVLFVPSLLVWLDMKVDNKPFDYFFSHSDYALYLILGYLAIYRIVIYIFLTLKTFDLRLWHTIPSTQAKLDVELEETKTYYKELDCVDGPPAALKKHALYAASSSCIPNSPRHPRSPRLLRVSNSEVDQDMEMDIVESPVLKYSTMRIPKRSAPPSPRQPHSPPAIVTTNCEAEIYTIPTF